MFSKNHEQQEGLHTPVGLIQPEGIANYWPRRRLFELTQKYPYLLNLPAHTLSTMGLVEYQHQLCLIPISIGKYFSALRLEVPDYLVHVGFARQSDIEWSQPTEDDLSNHWDNTISEAWGDTRPGYFTCLKPLDSMVSPMDRVGLVHQLIIDVKTLMRLRYIYNDPEMLIPQACKNFGGAENDTPGASLMVANGIPKSAIVSDRSAVMANGVLRLPKRIYAVK